MKEIIIFQKDRGLDEREYVPLNEHTSIIEDLLESIGLDVPKENRQALSDAIVEFVDMVTDEKIAIQVLEDSASTPREDKADAYCDVIVFAIGALLKLGYEPEQCLVETGKEINSRVGTMVNGKFEKDLSDEAKSNWYKADYSKCKRISK